MTAPTAGYVACPCGGRAPVYEPEWAACETCGKEFGPETGEIAAAMTAAGYRNDENHGWIDPTDKSWWLYCDACYYGWSHTDGPPERRGRWD